MVKIVRAKTDKDGRYISEAKKDRLHENRSPSELQEREERQGFFNVQILSTEQNSKSPFQFDGKFRNVC